MTGVEDGRIRRRPHRKSRHGCQQCKRRKIKCNEGRPVCLNCVQRDMDCSFTVIEQEAADPAPGECSCHSATCPARGHAPPPPPPPEDLRRLITSQAERLEAMSQQLTSLQTEVDRLKGAQCTSTLDHTELQLLHHYFLMTTHNHPREDVGHSFWCVRLLEMGFKHPHILHLILGFAALDKARSTPEQQADFFAKADRYHTIGLQDATLLLGAINDENYEVVYASALLISLHNIALGPQPGEYLGFSSHGRSGFMVFLRGLKSIREYNKAPENSAPYPELPAWRCALTDSEKSSNPIDYTAQIQVLRGMVEDAFGSQDGDLKTSCLTAVDQLEPFFAAAYRSSNPAPKLVHPSDNYVQVPLGWLCQVPDTYLNYLEAKNPLALIIFAHFAVILKELQSGWPIHEWPEHIMAGIVDFLPAERKGLLQWPSKQLGLDWGGDLLPDNGPD